MLRSILTRAGRREDERLEDAGADQMGLSLIEYSDNVGGMAERRTKVAYISQN